jgi:chromosome segregation ATPase
VIRRATSILLVACVLLLGEVTVSPLCWAQSGVTSDEELAAQKAYWQDRYRRLLQSAERLRQETSEARSAYAEANRRNYRRGGSRHVHRADLEKAEKELADVESQLAHIVDEARRAGALPGWLYEVEAETSSAPDEPAEQAPNAEEDETAGRNPLYLEDPEAKP